MKRKRKIHSAEFKARIATEALKGVKTVHEIAAENTIHPTQVSQWKKQLQDSVPEIFRSQKKVSREHRQSEFQTELLERKVGQLAVENDWLKKKCKELGIDE